MKKIHITEGQLNYIKKRLNEFNASDMPLNVDITQPLNAAGGDAKQALNSPAVRTALNTADPNNPPIVSVDPENVQGANVYTEGHSYSKKQLQEARLKNLKKNCVKVTKKNLK